MNIKKHIPTVLTIGGILASGTALYLGIKATPKASDILKEKTEEKKEPLTATEVVKAVWKQYLPTMIFAGVSVSCHISALILNKKQQASLIGGYAVLNEYMRRYKNGARIFGDDADDKIVTEMSRESYNGVPDIMGYSGSLIPSDESEKITFYDEFGDRYFESTLAKVIDAEYHFNRNLQLLECLTVNDFYRFLGIDLTQEGDSIGWSYSTNLKGYAWYDFKHLETELADGMHCIIISGFIEPTLLKEN